MMSENHLKTAYAYLYIRDFEAARRAFDQAIAADPLNPESYFHASVTALRNGEMHYAEMAAQHAVDLDPDNALYIAHLGAVRAEVLIVEAKDAFLAGDEQSGKELLQKAIEANPLSDTAHELLASHKDSI